MTNNKMDGAQNESTGSTSRTKFYVDCPQKDSQILFSMVV